MNNVGWEDADYDEPELTSGTELWETFYLILPHLLEGQSLSQRASSEASSVHTFVWSQQSSMLKPSAIVLCAGKY